jgi:general secretion pathway protein B
MSFILDALKKSERERERQRQPTPLDIPYGRRSRSQPLWLMVVIGLLLLNCVLLLVMWFRSGKETPVVVTSASLSSAAVSKPAVVIAPPRAVEVRPLQSEVPVESEPPADEAASALAEDNPAAAAPLPLVRPTTGLERAMAQQEAMANSVRATSPGSVPTSSNSTDSTPTLASLGGNGALNLPELRLDVHVYSSAANERFAFINSRKYVEGQTLSEGPHLERIVQDGVILSYRNQRFLLPRQ